MDGDGTPQGPRLTREELQRRMEAQFERVIRIGAMVFGERAEAPPPMQSPIVTPAGEPGPTFVKHWPEHLDLDTVQARLPFTLRLPAWVPDGFERLADVSFTGPGVGRAEDEAGRAVDLVDPLATTTVHLAWRHTDGRGFNYAVARWPELAAHDDNWIMPGITPVPRGSLREVRVGGEPAALLTRGFFFTMPGREGGVRDDAQLMWQAGRLHYSLMSYNWPEAGEALVAIAQAIPQDE